MKVRTLSLALLAFALVLSGSAHAQAADPQGTPADASVLATRVPDAPAAATLDGSPVDRKVENDLARIVQALQAASDRAAARSTAIDQLSRLALTPSGSKSVNLHAWLGFLNLEAGRPAEAAAALRPIVEAGSSLSAYAGSLSNLAMALYQMADYDAAARRFSELELLNPGSVEIIHLHGSSLLLGGRNEEAATVLKRAAQAASGARRIAILQDLAVAQHRGGDDAGALATYTLLEGQDALNGESLAWMGYLFLRDKDFPAAIRVLEKARALGVTTPDVINNLGNAYQNSGQAERAAEIYQIRPGGASSAAVFYNLGVQALRSQDLEEAARQFEAAIARSGSSEADRITLWSSHNNLGVVRDRQGNAAAAAASFAKASDLNPQSHELARNAGIMFFRARNEAQAKAYLLRAEALRALDTDSRMALAEIMIRDGDKPGALRIFQQEAARKPSLDLWFNIGVLLFDSGDREGAEAAYRKALEFNENDSDTLNNLGLLLLETGRADDAIAIFQRLSGAAPANLSARQNLAAALVRAERLNEAVEIWREIIRLDANRADVRINLADAYWNLGRPSDARFHYATVLRSDPNNARANNGMGLFYLQQTENARAEEHLRRAIQTDARYMPAYVNLAIALEKQNKVAQAVLTLEQALKIKSDYKPAQDALARLKSASMS